MPDVWRHMDMLLKPGGEMLHGIDFGFPSNFGAVGMLKATAIDKIRGWIPNKVRYRRGYRTPRGYVKLVFDTLAIKHKIPREFSFLNVALNPEILVENYAIGFNRIVKDGRKDYRYGRSGSILFHIQKV